MVSSTMVLLKVVVFLVVMLSSSAHSMKWGMAMVKKHMGCDSDDSQCMSSCDLMDESDSKSYL